MRVEKFRIGNYIYFVGDVKLIEGVSKRIRPDCGYFHIEGIQRPQKGIHVNPIQLTEEWLKKFGFVDFALNGFYLDLVSNDVIIDFKQGQQLSGVLIENIKYVHQLQNLYFTITGEEL